MGQNVTSPNEDPLFGSYVAEFATLVPIFKLAKLAKIAHAARGADDAARALIGPEPNRIYSARELVRRAAEPGPYHNFPESFNDSIFRGTRQVISEDYVLYTLRGSINGVSGIFEIACGLRLRGVRKRLFIDCSVLIHRECHTANHVRLHRQLSC
jgi:hypothetical protein